MFPCQDKFFKLVSLTSVLRHSLTFSHKYKGFDICTSSTNKLTINCMNQRIICQLLYFLKTSFFCQKKNIIYFL